MLLKMVRLRKVIPGKLQSLHAQEEELRKKATEIMIDDERFKLHLLAVQHAMDLADHFRQIPTEDENTKLIQILSMRLFNAFGASAKLALSGYGQNSALIMRDILETVFLLDFFNSDRKSIKRWRLADRKERMKNFSPIRIREALDLRDGFQNKKRAQHYEFLSELAGHPTMKSVLMLRPQQDGDAVIGPFIAEDPFKAVLSEMGRLAIQAGEVLDYFFPEMWDGALETRKSFTQVKQQWKVTFYSTEPTTPK